MQREGASSELKLKILLLGESGVGKSSLLLRYCENTFDEAMFTTIGLDYKFKSVDIAGNNVRIQVWDTAGQERFRNITQAYMRGAQAILLVYSVTDETSFRRIKHWINQIDETASDSVSLLLVGNKSDSGDRVVSTQRGENLAQTFNIDFYETSAATDTNVDEVFMRVATKAFHTLTKSKENPVVSLSPDVSSKMNKNCCSL